MRLRGLKTRVNRQATVTLEFQLGAKGADAAPERPFLGPEPKIPSRMTTGRTQGSSALKWTESDPGKHAQLAVLLFIPPAANSSFSRSGFPAPIYGSERERTWGSRP
jgi:hypothetical protein